MNTAQKILYYDLLRLHEIFLIWQKADQIFLSSFCKFLQSATPQNVWQINISDRKKQEKFAIFGMVYIILLRFTLCIRNSKAALVMIVGIDPLGDSQASNYAYKMWV